VRQRDLRTKDNDIVFWRGRGCNVDCRLYYRCSFNSDLDGIARTEIGCFIGRTRHCNSKGYLEYVIVIIPYTFPYKFEFPVVENLCLERDRTKFGKRTLLPKLGPERINPVSPIRYSLRHLGRHTPRGPATAPRTLHHSISRCNCWDSAMGTPNKRQVKSRQGIRSFRSMRVINRRLCGM
jgi:hypothetical protein